MDETLDFMKNPGHSIVRFGDGEMMILDGMGITNYQEYSDQLRSGVLRAINYTNSENLLVCMPEPICTLDQYVERSKKHWTIAIANSIKTYKKWIFIWKQLCFSTIYDI